MSSMPTHSSCPAAFVVMTRICTSGWLFAPGGNVVRTGVTRVAALGPVVASATYPPGAAANSPVAPTRYWTATGSAASAPEASMSRSTRRIDTADRSRVSSEITRCGALAVAEPWIATTGSASSNSATPAASPTARGSARLAVTSTGVDEPSAVTPRGSTPGSDTRPSPR
jgi:hypothetical protein